MQIGQVLREFHRIPMEAFGYIGSKGIWTAHSTNRAYLTTGPKRWNCTTCILCSSFGVGWLRLGTSNRLMGFQRI
jgi:hypothetical protein